MSRIYLLRIRKSLSRVPTSLLVVPNLDRIALLKGGLSLTWEQIASYNKTKFLEKAAARNTFYRLIATMIKHL